MILKFSVINIFAFFYKFGQILKYSLKTTLEIHLFRDNEKYIMSIHQKIKNQNNL
jgi:hypothetical protein